jgi:hypothetical protein
MDITLVREAVVSFPSLAALQIKYIEGLTVGAPHLGEIYPHQMNIKGMQLLSFVLVFLII